MRNQSNASRNAASTLEARSIDRLAIALDTALPLVLAQTTALTVFQDRRDRKMADRKIRGKKMKARNC